MNWPKRIAALRLMGRWRDGLAPALTCLSGLGVLFYLSAELHFTLVALGWFFIVATILVLPVGWLVVRSISRPNIPRQIRLGLAALVGYPVTVTIYFLLGIAHLEALYPILLSAASLICIALVVRELVSHFNGSGEWPASLLVAIRREVDWGGLFLYWLVLLISAEWFRYLISEGSDYLFVGYRDSLTHIAIARDLLRGVPPDQWPLAAGEPFPRYHIFSHLFIMLVIRYSGLEPMQVYYVFVPILLNGLVALGICLTLSTLFGNRPAGWLAMGALYLFGPPVEEILSRLFAIGAPSIRFLYVSSPAFGSLVVIVGLFACLASHHRLQVDEADAPTRRGLVYVAAYLAAVTYMFKAQSFVLIYPSFVGGLFLYWLRERRRYVLGGIVLSLLVVGLFMSGWSGPSWARLVIRYGVFADARLLGVQRLLEAKRYLYGLIEQYLVQPSGERLTWLGVLLLTLLIVWRFTLLSPILPAYLYNRFRASRQIGLWEVVFALLFPVALVSAFFLDAATRDLPPLGNLVAVMLIFLSFASLILNAILMGWFANREIRKRWRQFPAGASLLALLIAITPAAILVVKSRSEEGGIRLSSSELAAYYFLAQSSPLDAIVAQNKRSANLVSAFSGRRMLGAAQGRLYATHDWSIAASILGRNHVSYVIEYSESPLGFDKQMLNLVFDSGSVRVYAVAPNAKGAGAVIGMSVQ